MTQRVFVEPTPFEAIRRAADLFEREARACARKKDRFRIALSGGSTPRPLYRLLAEPPFRERIPWDRITVFWVDERCVPWEHPDSNFGAARADLLDTVPVPAEHIHPVPVNLAPNAAAQAYAEILRRSFSPMADSFPVFDFILLGLGTDGHTASLFPEDAALGETTRWVRSVTGGTPRVHRVTLTLPVINHARRIVFLITGAEKAGSAARVMEARDPRLPAAGVVPVRGGLSMVLDSEAAKKLQQPIHN